MGCKIGETVGYRVRFAEMLSQQTRIKFLTAGMLLREAILDPNLSKYAVVVLDEAHERQVDSDVMMALVKKISEARTDFRLVVMSATLDLDRFMKYFNSGTVVKVEGRTH